MKWWEWCLIVAALATALVWFAGCTHVGSDAIRREKEVQDCILRGGQPRLGPGNTVECPIPI